MDLTPQALVNNTGRPIVAVWSGIGTRNELAADLSPAEARQLAERLVKEAKDAEQMAEVLAQGKWKPADDPWHRPRVYAIAGNRQQLRDWADERDPSRALVEITSPDQLRGITLGRGDEIVLIGTANEREDWPAMQEQIRFARRFEGRR